MFKAIRNSVFLVGALTSGIHGRGQAPAIKRPVFDLAVTYTAERAKIVSNDCRCFWLNGGSFSGAATFYHGVGVAANLTGEHVSDAQPGVDLDKVAIMAGPRYTFDARKWNEAHPFSSHHPARIFGEALFGTMRGFNTIFPSSTGTKTSASSFAYQIGGGVDWMVTKKVGVRLVEADYVRSTLPNNDGDTQNDLRLAGGVLFHFR